MKGMTTIAVTVNHSGTFPAISRRKMMAMAGSL
jgi:hypothetical protein